MWLKKPIFSVYQATKICTRRTHSRARMYEAHNLMRTFVSTQGRYINLLTQCSRTYSRGIQRYDLDTADSLSHSERLLSIWVDSGRWPPVFITSRSRGPQLDVRNKSSVNDFLFGPEPVCRLTLNRVFSHVLHHHRYIAKCSVNL